MRLALNRVSKRQQKNDSPHETVAIQNKPLKEHRAENLLRIKSRREKIVLGRTFIRLCVMACNVFWNRGNKIDFCVTPINIFIEYNASTHKSAILLLTD